MFCSVDSATFVCLFEFRAFLFDFLLIKARFESREVETDFIA